MEFCLLHAMPVSLPCVDDIFASTTAKTVPKAASKSKKTSPSQETSKAADSSNIFDDPLNAFGNWTILHIKIVNCWMNYYIIWNPRKIVDRMHCWQSIYASEFI